MIENLFPFIWVKQVSRDLILTKLPAGLLISVSYASIRGQSSEEGAVQRILNSRRIASIKNFTLEGGDYPGAIVLNWINSNNPLCKLDNTLKFKQIQDSAQIIDGQHRLAGIKAAIDERSSVAELELAVAIYENLTTRECADIFLSINTEQKPVARSLVFDLYGLASEPHIDPAAVRARDIAIFLNETQESPFFDQIKFPGAPTRKSGIALSTVVTSIKPLVEDKGGFEQVGIYEFEIQKQIVLNFFTALKQKYEKEWESKSNAFQYAAGFAGAMDFLQLKIIPYCNSLPRISFTVETVSDIINLGGEDNLIYQSEVKGLGGKDAQKQIYQKLVDSFNPNIQSSREIEI
jgi:DNA sulfur modification protein DndB